MDIKYQAAYFVQNNSELIKHGVVIAPIALVACSIAYAVFQQAQAPVEKMPKSRRYVWCKRIVVGALALGTAACIAAAAPHYVKQACEYIQSLRSGHIWYHTKATVATIRLEYFTVAAAHLTLAAKAAFDGKGGKASHHLMMAGIGFVRPVVAKHDRLHHDFSGLVLSLIPSHAAKTIGAAYVADSLLYELNPYRGDDFANIVVDNPRYILGMTAAITAIEWLGQYLINRRQQAASRQPIVNYIADHPSEDKPMRYV